MNLNPQPNQSNQPNPGTSRATLFLAARLLGIQPPPVGIAICGPDENADDQPVQPSFDDLDPKSKDGNEQSGLLTP